MRGMFAVSGPVVLLRMQTGDRGPSLRFEVQVGYQVWISLLVFGLTFSCGSEETLRSQTEAAKDVVSNGAVIANVYLREIQVGLGQNMIFWLDDKIFDRLLADVQLWMRFESFNKFEKDMKFILKSHSATSMAYFRSELFRRSLALCDSFKIV